MSRAETVAEPTATGSPRCRAALARCLTGRDDAHKGTFGTVVVVGGAVGFSGAPLMSATAAARGGAGQGAGLRARADLRGGRRADARGDGPPAPRRRRRSRAGGAWRSLRERHLADATAWCSGPGSAARAGTEELVIDLLADLPAPAVVDADGLNIAAARRFDWRHVPPRRSCVTPHPAEMGRLCGIVHRRGAVAPPRAGRASSPPRTGVVVVLKGSDTVVAAPDGRVHVSAIRVVALATGGQRRRALRACSARSSRRGWSRSTPRWPRSSSTPRRRWPCRRGWAAPGALPRDLLEELPAAQERTRRALEGRRAR